MGEVLGAAFKGLLGGAVLFGVFVALSMGVLGGDDAERFGLVAGALLIPAAFLGASLALFRAASSSLVGSAITLARAFGGVCLAVALVSAQAAIG